MCLNPAIPGRSTCVKAGGERLILFAPPRALGQLREMLDEATRSTIDSEAAKDLTKLPLDELPAHLAALA